MIAKKKVKLRIVTKVNEETSSQQSDGELYIKDHSIYVRYREPNEELGETVTILKLRSDSVKIIRHGDVEMEQLFSVGYVTNSLYNTPQGAIELDAHTLAIDNRLQDGVGEFAWQYILSLDGESAGHFQITLHIQEEN